MNVRLECWGVSMSCQRDLGECLAREKGKCVGRVSLGERERVCVCKSLCLESGREK